MMKLSFSNGKETVGTGYIDLTKDYENDIQAMSRKFGATLAWSGDKKQVWWIKYDDKMPLGIKKRGLECEEKKK